MGERYLELRKEDPTDSYGFNIKGGFDIGKYICTYRIQVTLSNISLNQTETKINIPHIHSTLI